MPIENFPRRITIIKNANKQQPKIYVIHYLSFPFEERREKLIEEIAAKKFAGYRIPIGKEFYFCCIFDIKNNQKISKMYEFQSEIRTCVLLSINKHERSFIS